MGLGNFAYGEEAKEGITIDTEYITKELESELSKSITDEYGLNIFSNSIKKQIENQQQLEKTEQEQFEQSLFINSNIKVVPESIELFKMEKNYNKLSSMPTSNIDKVNVWALFVIILSGIITFIVTKRYKNRKLEDILRAHEKGEIYAD